MKAYIATYPQIVSVCPDGYTYAGDDPKHRLNRDYVLDEAERSPIYSCYKIFKTPASWSVLSLSLSIQLSIAFQNYYPLTP